MPEAVTKDIGNALSSDYTNIIDAVEIDSLNTDAATGQEETEWQNPDGAKWWGYFNECPELKSALLMKAIWVCGKGYKTDSETAVILDHITGFGKDSFSDILFNMEVTKRIWGDAFAEIIRDPDTSILLNLKPLDPGTINIICDSKGMLKRYEQRSKNPKNKNVRKFEPDEIFHLAHNRIADQIHGISDIKVLEKTILAEYENFMDMKKIMHHQAIPMILWKLRTDNAAKISAFVTKINNARNLGEDMFIPDDDDAVTHEVVQINISQIIMQWRADLNGKFYRALGLPLVLFGAAGSTESGSKMEYTAHEQVFEKDQTFLEQQIWNQLYLKISLTPPTSLLENLQADQAKDSTQGLEIQQSDLQAGAGR